VLGKFDRIHRLIRLTASKSGSQNSTGRNTWRSGSLNTGPALTLNHHHESLQLTVRMTATVESVQMPVSKGPSNTRTGLAALQSQTPDDVVITLAIRSPLCKARKGGFKDTRYVTAVFRRFWVLGTECFLRADELITEMVKVRFPSRAATDLLRSIP